MIVYWKKWILEQIPFALRVNRLFVLCLLFTRPVRHLHVYFSEWSRKMKNKAGVSPQICMLQKVVFDELQINIEIEEGDGMPYDFIVKSSRTTKEKEQQMLSLLNRYKLAGKSYQYIDKDIVSFDNDWSDYICEQCQTVTDWSDYVCEQKY